MYFLKLQLHSFSKQLSFQCGHLLFYLHKMKIECYYYHKVHVKMCSTEKYSVKR